MDAQAHWEKIYTESSLFGLQQALKAQGKEYDATDLSDIEVGAVLEHGRAKQAARLDLVCLGNSLW